MTRKRKIILIILSVFAGLLTIFCVKMYLFFAAKPNIAFNYAAEWNKISKPENYDPNQNAFFDYQRAAEYFAEIPEIMKTPDWPGDMNDAQMKILKDWVNDNVKAIEYIKEGSKKSYFWDNGDENADFRLFNVMFGIQAICWQAKLAALENQNQKIIECLSVCYRISRQFTNGKRTPMEQIFGIIAQLHANAAGFVILANIINENQFLEKFQSELEKEISKQNRLLDFSWKKNYMYDMIQDYFSDDGKGNGHLVPSEFSYESPVGNRRGFSLTDFLDNLFSGNNDDKEERPSILRLALFGPDRKQNVQMAGQLIQYYQDLQEKTPWQLHKENIDPDKYIFEELLKNYIVLKYCDLRTREIWSFLQSRTAKSALVTVTAILRFNAENSKYPDNLTELIVNGYMKELPQDPYNEGPLTYKNVGDDFMLYSLGPNFVDDDGKIIRDENGKIEWWEDSGDTVFWPRPKETKEEIEKREELKRQKEQERLEMLKELQRRKRIKRRS